MDTHGYAGPARPEETVLPLSFPLLALFACHSVVPSPPLSAYVPEGHAAAEREVRRGTQPQNVRAAPTTAAPIRGRIAANASFHVLRSEPPLAGAGCASEWGTVEEGFVCLDGNVASDVAPQPQPILLPFDPPTPEEYPDYVRTGTYARDPRTTEALLPFVFGKSWRRWHGEGWPSVAALEAGGAAAPLLDDLGKFHFVDTVETSKGTTLVRADGSVVPADDVFLYPVSRFSGFAPRDASASRAVPAWIGAYKGAPLRATPAADGAVLQVLPFQTRLSADAEPATPDGRWLHVSQPSFDGYVRAVDARRARPLPPPPGVGPDELWLDVDTAQQVLLVLRGTDIQYATLVSTGLTERATPPGVYRILDKATANDMSSRPGADEPYMVESVPWVMHFRPRYALHAVFWHWGFGNHASHGCVNLSPVDARRIFDDVAPALPDGWDRVVATEAHPGTTLRIRADTVDVRDFRAPPPRP